MIANKHLYRNQSSSQVNLSNSQIMKIPPNVNKTQLKELILAKYKKDFKNPKNIEKIKKIIDEHFTKLSKIDSEAFKQIKEDVLNKVGVPNAKYGLNPSYSMSQLSKTPKVQSTKARNENILPDISQSQLVSKNVPENQDKQKLEQIMQKQDQEQEKLEKQARRESNVSEKQQIPKIPTEEINRQLSQQLYELQNSTRQIQTDIAGNDSPRSVYQVQEGDEWTSMIHKDAEKFQREQQEKKERIKQNQQQMKKQLDQQVKIKKILRHKQRNEDKTYEHALTLNEIERFDKIEETKKLKLREKAEIMGKMLRQQKEIKDKEKEQRIQEEDQLNASIVQRAQNEYQIEQSQKNKKKIEEYKFFQKVREENERYQETIRQDPRLSNPQNNLFKKNYDNIARDYSNVYRKSSMDYPGMDQYFERNKEQREKMQKQKIEQIQKLVEPLQQNFKVPDAKMLREEEKQYYQSKFQRDLELQDQEKQDAFMKKQRLKEEINRDLDKQVNDNVQKRQNARNQKYEQAQLWEQENKLFSERQSEKLKKQKQTQQQLQEYLKQQMSEKAQNKKGYRRMNNEELLYNKSNLKDMYSSVDQNTNGNIFQKAQTSNFKHIKHVA